MAVRSSYINGTVKQTVSCIRGSGSWIWNLYVSWYFIILWNVQDNLNTAKALKKKKNISCYLN